MVRSSKRRVKWACGVCERDCHACVYCDGCKAWFHAKCENLTTADLKLVSNLRGDYLCCSCTKVSGFCGSIKRLKGSGASLSSKVKMEEIYLKRIPLQLCPIEDPRTRPIDRLSLNMLKISGGASGLLPAMITEDGNCLFNSLSVASVGDESAAAEIRLRTYVEMVTQKGFYTGQHNKTPLALVSPKFSEACTACRSDGGYSSAWTIHAAATVLGTSIQCIYPTVNGLMDQCVPILNRTFTPRPSNHAQARKDQIKLMWTGTRAPQEGKTWVPNHFVPLIQHNPPNVVNLDCSTSSPPTFADPETASSVKAIQDTPSTNSDETPMVEKASSPDDVLLDQSEGHLSPQNTPTAQPVQDTPSTNNDGTPVMEKASSPDDVLLNQSEGPLSPQHRPTAIEDTPSTNNDGTPMMEKASSPGDVPLNQSEGPLSPQHRPTTPTVQGTPNLKDASSPEMPSPSIETDAITPGELPTDVLQGNSSENVLEPKTSIEHDIFSPSMMLSSAVLECSGIDSVTIGMDEESNGDDKRPPPVGAMRSKGKFLSPDEVFNTLQTNAPTSNEVPQGIKEDVFFVINNVENVSRKMDKKSAVHVDDCGAWTGNSGKTHHYIIKDDELFYVDLKDGLFYQSVKKRRVPVDPQPNDEDIIVFKRYYLSLKRQISYRKRVSTVSRCPNSMSNIKHLALVEYIGKYPDGSAVHGNAKKTTSDYVRTTTAVKRKLDDLVEMKSPQEVYQDMVSEGSTSAPRDLKQVYNVRYKKIRTMKTILKRMKPKKGKAK